MKICPKCGFTAMDDENFCQKCGEPFSTGVTEKFCPNCGEKVGKNDKACANCGKALDEEIKPQKSKKIGIIAGVAAAAVLCVGIIFGMASKLFAAPYKDFVKFHQELAASHFFNKMEKTIDIYGKGEFSSDLTISARTDSEIANRLLEGSSIKLKIDARDDEFTANGELNVTRSPVLSANLFYDGGQFGFNLPELDSNNYVFDVEELFESNGVEFDPEDVKMPKISGKETCELIRAYFDIIYTAVNKDNVTLEKSQGFDMDFGDGLTGNVYTFRPRAEDITEMVNKIADHMENDEALKDQIHDYLRLFVFQNMSEYYSNVDNFEAALEKLPSRLRENASSIGEKTESSGFVWRLYTSGGEVCRIAIGVSEQEDSFVYENTGDRDGKHVTGFGINSRNAACRIANEYAIDQNRCSGRFYIEDAGNGTTYFSLEYDTENNGRSTLDIPFGNYSFYIPDADADISIAVTKGSGSDGDKHEITVKGVRDAFNGMTDTISITVKATESGTAVRSDAPIVDITDYTQEEFDKLGENLARQLQNNVLGNLGALLS